jgi:zinc protease
LEKLENGLTVVLLPLPGSGLVAVQTWMDVGSRDEVQAGQTGYAHFFEHLMFHGSRALPAEAREARLLSLGADENAWTSKDFTCYHLLVDADGLEEVLTIEADRFQGLHLEAEAVRREAGAVMGEYRKSMTSAERGLYEALWDAAFDQHPYGHSTLGLRADIEAMPEGISAARDFFSRHYQPEKAVLVVAGDLKVEEALAAVRRSHGGWKKGPGTARALPEEPAPKGPERVERPWSGPTNPRLGMGWRVPAFTPGEADGAALMLAAELLCSPVSPLYRDLVQERRLLWSLSCEPPDHRSPGLFEVYAELNPGEDAAKARAEVERAIEVELASWREGNGALLGPRVQAARERARRQQLLELDSPDAWAFAVGAMVLRSGGDLGALERHVTAMGAVEVSDLRRVAQRYLRPEGQTVVWLAGGAQ